MKQFYPTTHFQSSSLLTKPFTFLVATILFFSGTVLGQKAKEDKEFSQSATVQSFLPGTLVNWTVKLDKNKVVLGWTTTIEMNSLHFTIEKSFNGVDYTDAGILYAAGNSGIRKEYAFTDKLSHNSSKNIYYRLKMVDLDANVKYSDVRTVRATALEEVNMEVYPNPAVNDLKVTVAASWVSKKLVIEVYNINGILVKAKVNENSKETETLSVAGLPKGLYVVKVSNGETVSVQRFLKN